MDDWKNLGLSQDSFGNLGSNGESSDNERNPNAAAHDAKDDSPNEGRPAFIAGIKTARARQKKKTKKESTSQHTGGDSE